MYCGAHVGLYSETVNYVTRVGNHSDMADGGTPHAYVLHCHALHAFDLHGSVLHVSAMHTMRCICILRICEMLFETLDVLFLFCLTLYADGKA